jgi:integrase
VFTSRERAAVNRNYLNGYVWKPALRAAGVPPDRENGFHALRHHFASALLHNGVDIRALAAYLGHSDPGFTLRTYVHLMPDADDRMRQAVDVVMNAAAGPDGPATAREGKR